VAGEAIHGAEEWLGEKRLTIQNGQLDVALPPGGVAIVEVK